MKFQKLQIFPKVSLIYKRPQKCPNPIYTFSKLLLTATISKFCFRFGEKRKTPVESS